MGSSIADLSHLRGGSVVVVVDVHRCLRVIQCTAGNARHFDWNTTIEFINCIVDSIDRAEILISITRRNDHCAACCRSRVVRIHRRAIRSCTRINRPINIHTAFISWRGKTRSER
ncbi:hypothetical protein D3C72_1283580 [compost metagenome]